MAFHHAAKEVSTDVLGRGDAVFRRFSLPLIIGGLALMGVTARILSQNVPDEPAPPQAEEQTSRAIAPGFGD